jgi:hypothetical protein
MVTSPFQTTIGTTPTQAVPSHEKRTALGIANLHATAIVYYSTDPGVSTTSGFPIYPKTVRDLNIGLGDDPTRAIYVVSDTATTPIAISEQYKGE